MLTVLEMAPDRKGCTAAIMRRWPMGDMAAPPALGRGRRNRRRAGASPRRWGAPSRVPLRSSQASISSASGAAVSQAAQGLPHAAVDDPEHPAAHQALVLDQGDVRLHPGGVAVHHEGDGARGRQHGNLGISVSVGFSQGQGLVPGLAGGQQQLRRDAGGVQGAGGGGMAVHHLQHGGAVGRNPAKGPGGRPCGPTWHWRGHASGR